MSPGYSSASLRPSTARPSKAMNGETYASRSPWRVIASSTRRSPCPMFTPISWEFRSR